MIYSTEKLIGKSIVASGGETIATCDDFFFDESTYELRYMVADTGGLLSGEKTLVSPQAIGAIDRLEGSAIPVELTRDAIKSCPSIDMAKPISRELETSLHRHYGWTPYWSNEIGTGMAYSQVPGTLLPGEGARPGESADQPREREINENRVGEEIVNRDREEGQSQLRSVKEVSGYDVRVADEKNAGKIKDFHVDTLNWRLGHVIVDLHPWLPVGNRVVPIERLQDFDALTRLVHIDANKAQLKACPNAPSDDAPLSESDAHLLENQLAHPSISTK